MIKIISTHLEKNTDEVIDFLLAKKINFSRINYEDFHSYTFEITNNNDYNSDIVHWHRRGRINFNPKAAYPLDIKKYVLSEEKILLRAYENFNKEGYFGSYIDEEEHNKILDLKIAAQLGLKIPATIVTNTKKDLLKFHEKFKFIITKALNYSFSYQDNNTHYQSSLTIRLNKNDLNNLSDFFLPSIFQEEINKLFEVRVFYFNRRFFSMAIFSQEDPQTEIDYRNYNLNKPNRYISFNLPDDIKKKLLMFIKKKKSKTGSIDLIYSKNKDFVFLEDNPMGQYDWVSKFCNYYIEEYIFESLINEENIRKRSV